MEQAVTQGKVLVWVTPLSSPLSSFRVRTPSSVAAVQGTIFEVTVDDLGGALWQVRQGEVVSVPPPPRELTAQASVVERVNSLLTQLAEKSVKEQKTEVQVAGTQIAGINQVTNSVVFNLLVSQATPPQPPAPAPVAALQEGLVAKQDELVERLGALVTAAVSTKPVSQGLPPILVLPLSREAPAPVNPPRSRALLVGITQPLGVAVSPDGRRIYVTESEGRRLTRIFDNRGDQVAVLEPPDSFPLNRRPVYVAVDSGGKVYVSDRVRHTIDIFGPDGAYIGRFAPNGNLDFDWAPLALLLAPTGRATRWGSSPSPMASPWARWIPRR